MYELNVMHANEQTLLDITRNARNAPVIRVASLAAARSMMPPKSIGAAPPTPLNGARHVLRLLLGGALS